MSFARVLEGEIVRRDHPGYCTDCGGDFIVTKREPIFSPITGKIEAYWIHKKCPNTRWWHMAGVFGKCWPYYKSWEVAPKGFNEVDDE